MQRLIISLIAILFINCHGSDAGKDNILLKDETKGWLQNICESNGFDSFQVFHSMEDEKKILNIELITTGELPIKTGENQPMEEALGKRVFKSLDLKDRQEYQGVVVWFVEDHDRLIVKKRYAEAKEFVVSGDQLASLPIIRK